jgi:hypothetical protein
MATIPASTFAAVLAVALVACAQAPTVAGASPEHASHHPAAASTQGAAATPAQPDPMAMMDKHMQAMREMHDKMDRARTPEERQALMADHAKLMREGMSMMGGMGHGGAGHGGMGMGGMGCAMGRTAGAPQAAADMAMCQQMMEKRMDMMQSMMQMMMDRMHAPASGAK